MTLQRKLVVPEELLSQVVPSDEVRIVPILVYQSPATATKVLIPNVIPLRGFVVPDCFAFHVIPSEDVRMVPASPTATKVLFA